MLYLTVKHMPDDVPGIGEEYILAKIDFVGFVDQLQLEGIVMQDISRVSETVIKILYLRSTT